MEPNFLDIPKSRILVENDLAFAILDKFPISPGHTLIITKRLVKTWWETSEAEKVAVMSLLEKLKQLLDQRYAPDAFNVGFNAGAIAGQTIHHFHLHVIPRYRGDVLDPRGGIRKIFPEKADYWSNSD